MSAREAWQQLPAPHGHVQMRVEHLSAEASNVDYRGTAEQLIAAGIATESMALPGRSGSPRRDARGWRFFRKAPTRNGIMEIMYWSVPRARVQELPFVADPSAWLYRLLPISDAQRADFEQELSAHLTAQAAPHPGGLSISLQNPPESS